jgi:hypothetical protein
MKRNLCGMLISCAVIAGMALIVFPVAAEVPLSKEAGRKWGEKCAGTGNSLQCCSGQRNGETACKGIEHSPSRRDCEDAEKVCQGIVRSAEEAKKAEEEKKKKAEEAKKAEEKKPVQQGIPRLPSAADLAKQIDDVKNDAARIEEQLSRVASKEELEELKKQASKDQETIARVTTVLEGRQRSVIETNPPDWTVVRQKIRDVGDKIDKVQKKILHCVLGGDATSGDSKDNKVPPPTNVDPTTQGKHVVGCKFDTK